MGDHLVHQVYDEVLVAKRDVHFSHQLKHEPEDRRGCYSYSVATMQIFHADELSNTLYWWQNNTQEFQPHLQNIIKSIQAYQ